MRKQRCTFHPPNGESWQEAEQRLLTALNQIVTSHAEKNIILVTHAGSIRILLPVLLKTKREESYKYDPDNASITVLNYNNKRKFTQIVYNDIRHLSPT